jgi:hypothetical protein
MSIWTPDKTRMEIAGSNNRSNCVGTALFLTGCIDNEIEIYPTSFSRDLPRLLSESENEPGKIIALYEGSALRHMAIIDGNRTVTHRYLKKISAGHSLDRMIRTYEDVMHVTTRFFSPEKIMLSPYHYSGLDRERFLGIYADKLKQLIQEKDTSHICAADSRL